MDRLVTAKQDPSYSLEAWLDDLPKELDFDAISLNSIVDGLRSDFGLDGADIEEAVRESLISIMECGGRPVQGHSDGNGGGYWTHVTRFGDEPGGIVDGIIREWHDAGVDPDITNIWFAIPTRIAVPAPHPNQRG